MFTPDTCCTLVPYFEVQEGQLDAFKALAQKLVAKTRTEPGCMHYASEAEIDKLRGPMAARSPQFFALEEGIRRSSEA